MNIFIVHISSTKFRQKNNSVFDTRRDEYENMKIDSQKNRTNEHFIIPRRYGQIIL